MTPSPTDKVKLKTLYAYKVFVIVLRNLHLIKQKKYFFMRNRNSLHECFEEVMDDIVNFELNLEPRTEINYQPLTAFENLLGCVKSLVKDHFTIQYGYTHISESYDQSIDVTEIHEHADFQMIRPFPNDVAVLKLASAIPFGGNAQPIVLPRQYESAPVNGVSTLVGWGYLVTDGQVSTTLQMVNLKIYIHEECEAAHPTVEWEYNLCSGVDEGWKGQCSGDSGGPLTADGKQVGIVSWSEKPCGKKGYPGIYTRVSSYVDWINGKISA
ncbi:hypothetical protein FQA39_LY16991 [Lamprigera yunnana]|nr:hypothetical protein FQA39_LY16991 [Lamprigera yunnana]